MIDNASSVGMVDKTIDIDGLNVSFHFDFAQAAKQTNKGLKARRRLATTQSLKDAGLNWAMVNPYSPTEVEGVRDDLLADKAGSAKVIEDFQRALAALTDDEALRCVAKKAQRKKDGHLAANRVALRVSMDGVFEDGTYYVVTAKSEKADRIVISIAESKVNAYSHFEAETVDFLKSNKRAVERAEKLVRVASESAG